jgi:nucleoid-associated protein YgaU
MAVTTNKALLFLTGGVAAAAAVAYSAGAFDPLMKRPAETIAALPEAGQADPKDSRLPFVELPGAALQTPTQPAEPEAATPATPETAPETAKPETPPVVPPSFDVVRVEGDGSIVVAGKAVPSSKVDLLVGSNMIGSALAGTDGDFAVVLDDPLKPGDYQIVLRATAPGNVVAMSVETAVVSVPETADGQVLALVEEPGKPSQMITLPEPQAPAAAAKPAETAKPAAEPAPAAEAPAAAAPKPQGEVQAALPQTVQPAAPAPAPASPPPAGPSVRVDAVEIDGRKIFVAGSAERGRTVRGYANEILLGDAKVSPDGSYLIEAERDLPVGDYIIRVDALEPDGVKVAARAAVPFEREPGETIAAVAPQAPAPAPAAEAPAAAAPAPGTDTGGGAPAATPPVAVEAPAAAPAAPAQTAPAPETPAAVAEAPSVEPPASAPGSSAQAPTPQTQAAADASGVASQPAIEEPTAPAADASAAVAEVPAAEAPAAEAQAGATAEAQAPATEQPAAPAATVEAPLTEAPATEPAAPAEPASPAAVAEAPATEASPAAQAPAADAPPAAETAPLASPETDVASAEPGELPTPPPAGVNEVLAPKLQSAGGAVIIRRGDSLWRISRRVYGRGVRYSTIYLANESQIEDPDRIWPGQVFKVPEKSADGEADADYSTLGDSLTTAPEEGAQ